MISLFWKHLSLSQMFSIPSRPAPPPPAPPARKTAALQIRAPSELLLGLPANLRTTEWRHSAQTLLNEHINYEVQVSLQTIVDPKVHNWFPLLINYKCSLQLQLAIPCFNSFFMTVPRLNGCERTTWHRVHQEVHTKAEDLS